MPELRPYRSRGEISTWAKDPTLIPYLEDLLSKRKYRAIGEFHIYGADADLPNVRRVVELAKQYGLFLHSHSDADAVTRHFQQDPARRRSCGRIRVSSARRRCARCCAGIRPCGATWPFLTLASRTARWRRAGANCSSSFPTASCCGGDTFTPERWHYVIENARWSRQWLSDLPPQVRAQDCL